MKRCSFLLVIVLVLLCFAGCQQPTTNPPECSVEVVIDGGSGEGFPECLVGRWKVEKPPWEIVFQADGSISSIVHTIAQVKMQPCESTTVKLRGGEGLYEPGQWYVQYDHDHRDLIVEIELANYKLEVSGASVSGRSKDLFVGKVSEDCTKWYAEWTADPKYIVNTDEYTDYDLPLNETVNRWGVIVFRKVED